MPFNRTGLYVALGLLMILLASPVFGQETLGYQYFAPPDLSTAGGEPAPNEGYFFQFDGLYWSVSAPKIALVGANPGATPPNVYYSGLATDVKPATNSLDTSDLNARFSAGTRFEFGRIEDRNGWLFSIFQLKPTEQDYSYGTVNMIFNDQPYLTNLQLLQGLVPSASGNVLRNLPVVLYDVEMKDRVDTWGVELMFLHRTLSAHAGGTLEFFGGPRYLEFNEQFAVYAGADPGGHTVPSFLSDSYWQSSAENHVVGGQIGLRWFKKQDRWTLSTEGRFMAGMNCQNIRQVYSIGPHLDPGGVYKGALFTPINYNGSSGSYDDNSRVFTPLVELRVEGRYQITRAVSFHAGWTGFWMNNIARANSVVDYAVPDMGINMGGNKQGVFVNGLTMGFDVNR